MLQPGTELTLLARSAEGEWYQIAYPADTDGRGWVIGEFLDIQGSTDGLPLPGEPSTEPAPAPDQAAGGVFGSSFASPVIGGAGHVAFGGRLSGPGITTANNRVLYAGLPGAIRRVAQRGQSAPQTEVDTVLP